MFELFSNGKIEYMLLLNNTWAVDILSFKKLNAKDIIDKFSTNTNLKTDVQNIQF